MAEIWEESEEEVGDWYENGSNDKGSKCSHHPDEVRIDECKREELRLAKRKKCMAVFRIADHPRRSARLQAEQLRLQQLTLLALFTLFTLPCTWPTVTCHAY